MIHKAVVLFALAAFASAAAYAGPHCGKMRAAYYTPHPVMHNMLVPAYHAHHAYPAKRTYAMHHGDKYASSRYAGDSYAYGMERKEAAGTKKNKAADVVDTAIAAGSFETLVTAVKAAGLVDTLKGEGPFTVFAPSDEAFAKLPKGTLEGLLADKEKLARVLTYHVVAGKFKAKDLIGKESLDSVEGTVIPASSLKVSGTNIIASNGVIHVIDEVLIPQM